AAYAAERNEPEDSAGDTAPQTAQTVQRPYAQHIVDLPLVGRDLEHLHEDDARHSANDKSAERMHHIGARAYGDETGERAVVHKARIVIADDQRSDDAAAHGHERVHGDEAGDRLEPLRAHHVEAEPADAQQP